ncbi:MAG: anti-sigma regulatory factor [Acidimicrobiaceae bacterium]|nr:anti-sigma regulatory factor [Acidimicrobiaceae bacterium]
MSAHLGDLAGEAATEGWANLGDSGDFVELQLPVHPELWALARMSASAIAARLDFGVDAVEDLRLAIDELCNSCAAGADGTSRLQLDYRWDEDSIHVACAVAPVAEDGAAEEASLSSLDLSRRILDALVDDHDVEAVKAGQRRGWLVKRRPIE